MVVGAPLPLAVKVGEFQRLMDTAINVIVATIPVEGGALSVAVNPSGTRAYVTNFSNHVSVIDTATNRVVARVGGQEIDAFKLSFFNFRSRVDRVIFSLLVR